MGMGNDSYKGNILAIDDTPANLRLLVEILTEQGYKVRAVPNGKLALPGISQSPPDLILLDIMTPEMDGYEVCSNLKADEKTKDIPVIFISAINEVLDKVKAFEVGGVDYITKPFQVEEVLARVETHFAVRSLQKNLHAKNEDLARTNEKLVKTNEELAFTLQQLKTTQEELIQSEKLAALGQLIAGIAHEINTPLGAIRSSVEDITDFFTEYLKELPTFFQKLSLERQQDFSALFSLSLKQPGSLSSKEKRQLRKDLKHQLEFHSIDKADILASTLVNIGLCDDIQPFLPLLEDSNSEEILKTIDNLANAWKSTLTISTATEKAAKVVFALKSYARYDLIGEKLQTNITEGIETVLTLYHSQFKQGVEVIKNYEDSPKILCYPDELNQVWTNLIHNALQAMDYKGILAINVMRQEPFLLISITDSGKGIPPEFLPKIFQPFFTTKPPGEGSGLGLDIVKKILEKHQGKIEVESVPGKTTFTVFLPINLSEDITHA